MTQSLRHKSWGWQAGYAIKDKFFEKLLNLNDKKYAALLLIEFFLTMLIVAGILLYLDGRFTSMEPPLNIFAFAAICFAAIHFYNYTASFRRARKNATARNNSLKAAILEFAIFFVIVISAYVYYDPAINVVQYPYNLLLFLGILVIPLSMYINEKFLRAN